MNEPPEPRAGQVALDLDLNLGLTIEMGIAIKQQTRQGRKVICEVGVPNGAPRATVALDTDDALYFSVVDAANKEW